MQANGINTVLDEDDMDYALTLMSEDDSGETASDRKKRRRLLHSYEEGRIHALLRRVERKSYYKNLPKAIDRYKPKDGYEQSLPSVMKEGLEFLTPEHGIMEYGYDPFYEEEPDFLPMYLSKQIRVIYDCTDMVTFRSPPVTCLQKRRNCSIWTTIRNVSSNGRKNSSTSQYKPI